MCVEGDSLFGRNIHKAMIGCNDHRRSATSQGAEQALETGVQFPEVSAGRVTVDTLLVRQAVEARPVGVDIFLSVMRAHGLSDLLETIIEVLLPQDDGESCTPGFWRNTRKRLDEWYLAGFDPSDSFDAAMDYCVDTGLTMEQAVNQRGGKEGKLIRFGA